MSVLERHLQVLQFVQRWKGRGDEKQETQRFWIDLLSNVLGVKDVTEAALFEHRTVGGGYIDVLCPEARLLVEQKSAGIDMDKPETRQGTPVTPVEQALRYSDALPLSQKPAVICTCNFERFRFYDLEKDPRATGEPADEFTLDELGEHLGTLESIFSTEHSRLMVQQKLSEHAGILVANLHNALAKQYADPDDPEAHHSLAVLTVRIVFCLYAEDAGLFPANAFSDYIKGFDANHLRRAVIDLFQVLNTPKPERDKYLEDELAAFDYVNGGLFAEGIEIPPFTDEIRDAMIHAGEGFQWKDISPVIFGSLMEETLSHDQRRKGGMHYTTVKNIHRLIDPLFLDGLKTELKGIEDDKTLGERARENRLLKFQDKLASLKFLDPACGSGNFLTETFLRLRELENQAVADRLHGQGFVELGDDVLVKVKIDQFHGIEINDFAVAVAKTALWIAEQQALDDTETIAGQSLPHLPLHDSGNIVQANALQYDWNELLPSSQCDYVMGNPPFVGRGLKTDEQVAETKTEFGPDYDGNLDYAANWFHRAATYLADQHGKFAFVSTNSISQGLQVPPLFGTLQRMGWHIAFAHRTFKWNAESTDNANVHVVIVGMSRTSDSQKYLYEYAQIDGEPTKVLASNINGYLIDAPDVTVEKSMRPLSLELSPAAFGSKPTDGGHLILDNHTAYEEAMAEPIARKYVRPFRMGAELINGIDRWCLWLVDATPSDMRQSRFLNTRIEAVKQMRLASKAASTRQWADRPWLFKQRAQPQTQYLAIPRVFSQRREYTTCALYPPSIIAGDKVYTCIDPNGLNFAVIESSMFMTWQKAIGGRLKSDPSFSNTLVWNTLPLPRLSDEQRQQVIDAGKRILEARANHSGQSLADLYDPTFMPVDLRKAHEQLDKVVDIAFGAVKPCADDEERLRILFTSYAEIAQMRGSKH